MKRFFIICILGLLTPSVHAATPSPDLQVYFTDASVFGLEWCKEDWTGDDAPFKSIKATLDNQIAKGSKRDVLLSKYKKSAQQNPTTASLQFGYAYAAWLASQTVTNGRQIPTLLVAPSEAMGGVKSPHSYEYTRLRWILEHRVGRWRGFMPIIGLGKRLMARNPRDRVVRYYLMEELLMSSVHTDETVELLRYAQQVENEPNKKASTYALLGDVYRNTAFLLRSPSYASKSIANYQRYLDMTPRGYFPEYQGLIRERMERTRKRKIQYSQGK